MTVEFRETGIAGCHLVVPTVHADDRGVLVKTYLESAFADRGLPTHFPEQFYSRSRRGVVRGLHVQLPPGPEVALRGATPSEESAAKPAPRGPKTTRGGSDRPADSQ